MTASVWTPTVGFTGLLTPWTVFSGDPTGSRDSTDALDTAVFALDPVIGGTIVVPPGNFLLRPRHYSNRNNINFLGMGRYASNFLSTEAGYLLQLSGCQWFKMQNMGVGQYGTPHAITDSYGIRLDDYSSNCEISSNIFYGFEKDAVQLIGTSAQPLSGNKLLYNYFLGNGRYQLQEQYSHDYHIVGNQFGNLAGIAFAEYGRFANQSSAGTYTQNYHWNNGVGCLELSGNYDLTAHNRFEESRYEGYVRSGGADNIFSNNRLHTNSNVADGTRDAAYFQNSSNLSILNNQVFSFDARKHFWGINVDSGCSNLTLLGNQIRAFNATAGPIRVSGATSGFINTDEKDQVNSAGTIAAGTTAFVGTSGVGAVEVDRSFVSTSRNTPIRFYAAVVAAPGAGQSFTYTLRKNGVDTGITFQISGAASFAGASWNPTPAVIFNPDEQYSFKVVTSAGAAVTTHRISLIKAAY